MDNQQSQQTPITPLIPEAPQLNFQPVQIPLKHSNFPQIFLIGLALILFGILVGILAARFLPMSSTTAPVVTPTPTVTLPETPTPTIDETANWETYTNTKYKYLVKYPSDWTTECDGQPCDSAPILRVTAQSTNESGKLGLDIIVKPKMGIITPKNAFTSAVATQIISQQETVVDGIPAYEGIVREGSTEIGPFLKQQIFVVNNDHIYQITFLEKLDNGDETSFNQPQLFDQILSTFKFTDATSSQQVLGIQLDQCCSCPTMVDASQIGKNSWVAYEQERDYVTQRPKECSLPNISDCAPCPLLITEQCLVDKEYVNSAAKSISCQCPTGYSFKTISTSWGPCPEPKMKDCPQTTVKCEKSNASSFVCPLNGWVSCMPILSEEGKRACSAEAMAWYKANCPNFQGAAL